MSININLLWNYIRGYKMEDQKVINYNFHHFIKRDKEIVLDLEELFRFINDNFNEFYAVENLHLLLKFVHRCIKVWVSREDYSKVDIGILLANLIAEHSEEDSDTNIVLQIVYQFLNSIKHFIKSYVFISEKLLRELIQIVTLLKNRTSASNCIACIQIYTEMFPNSRRSLESLWSHLLDQFNNNFTNELMIEIEIDILVQLFNDFKSIKCNLQEEPILVDIIHHLVKSDQRKFRKCGYYLLKKIVDSFMENLSTATKGWMSFNYKQQIERSWIIYITALENLEEEQSHLILPSLENVEELTKNNNLPSEWLSLLYMKMLTCNNHLVVRWSIEFFLNTFSCSDLTEETLTLLLEATNKNSLFNYEGYFLETKYISSFLKGDLLRIIPLFSEVANWQSVPLYVWLEKLNESKLLTSLTYDYILKLSSCVRKLQNPFIRKKAIQVCQELFKDFVLKMSMKEYVMYVETLYNSSDAYQEHDIFFSKKSSLLQALPACSIFKQQFCDIFTNTELNNGKLLPFLLDIPIEQHGWFKFAPFKLKLSQDDLICINNLYGMNLNVLATYDIHQVIAIFEKSLLYPSYEKKDQFACNQAAISFCIYQKILIELKDEDTLRFILNSLLNNKGAIDDITKTIFNNSHQIFDLWFFDELLKYKSKDMLENVSRYLCKFYDEEVVKKYAITILKLCDFELNIFDEINLVKELTDVWFKEVASHGHKRIEEAFCYNHFLEKTVSAKSCCLQQITRFGDWNFVLDLLKYHKDITDKKPRYYENSMEHRIKLRIATCILHYSKHKLINTTALDQIWNIILNENNQLNITYIYEYILGTYDRRHDLILSKLREWQNCTQSQQLSIISVVLTSFNERDGKLRNYAGEIIQHLLTFTMGANFQTRLLAQMSLYKILGTWFSKVEANQRTIKSIEEAAGGNLHEYLNDLRLHIFDLNEYLPIDQVILRVTNAPFDEIHCHVLDVNKTKKDYEDKIMLIESCRKRYLSKFTVLKTKETTSKSTTEKPIQRKMNPVNDLTQPHSLNIYPIEENPSEMFVVASLIDKLPNLGGIARTCDVLGIKNLVLNSIMQTKTNDFKNLSMTAEKALNILEVKPKDLKDFLIQKKLDGYKIIGAEQTSNSENFCNFQFPKKCVLLLGHEKDGIPATLLNILDNAVEVPQFGQVRSLNVHVTGALFMWEYCKQHLIQQ